MNEKEPRLTKKQADLLRFLYDFRKAHGESPTLTMTIHNQGLASNRSVIDMIRLLINKGYLEPAAKVSRSTKLTSKALAELNLLNQSGSGQPLPAMFVTNFAVPTSAQASWASPEPSWPGAEQPKGSLLNPGSEDITRLLKNAASLLLNAGTSPEPTTKPRLSTHPIVFFFVCCGAIIWIFGTGIEGAVLFAVVVLIITIRSIR